MTAAASGRDPITFLQDGRDKLTQSTQLKDRLFHTVREALEATDIAPIDRANVLQLLPDHFRGRCLTGGMLDGAD